MDKQFKYAERKSVPYIVILGSRELQEGNAVVKNLGTGEQQTVAATQLAAHIAGL
jgi:histidyl-tRNA synthetase